MSELLFCPPEAIAGIDPEKPNHECGIVGVWSPEEPAATIALLALNELQHRGQQGAGVFVYDKDLGPIGHKGPGLINVAVPEAFPRGDSSISALDAAFSSPVALAHVRWGTSESTTLQPLRGDEAHIAVVHNGNVPNATAIAIKYGAKREDCTNDSHAITLALDILAARITSEIGEPQEALRRAVREIAPQFEGGYCLAITDGQQMIAARDPWGLHPLALGTTDKGGLMVASEDVAFNRTGIFLRDVERGEIVTVDKNGICSEHMPRQEPTRSCLFEYAYFERPDTVADGARVYDTRYNMGRFLAYDYPVDADVVVAAPDSGIPVAAGFAIASGLPSVPGIMKSPYVGRSFIEAATKREDILRDKFRFNRRELDGKRIVLTDDSLIRGGVMGALINVLRDHGVKEVHVRIATPPYKYPCYMGMDTANPNTLMAATRTEQEICAAIGADSIGFNSFANCERAVRQAMVSGSADKLVPSLCQGCTKGVYPIRLPRAALEIPGVRSEQDRTDN